MYETTDNTFDYDNPLSQANLEEIAASGSQRTALGKTVQILASLYGGEAGNQFAWNIFDVDQMNMNINLVKSAFKQITNSDLPDIYVPNVAELTARVIEDTARRPDGTTVKVPNSVNLLFDVSNDNLGQDFFQNFYNYMVRDDVLSGIQEGKYDIPPPSELTQPGNIFASVQDLITDQTQRLGVSINRLIGGKAGEIILNKIGLAQGAGFVGSMLNIVGDALQPNTAEEWSEYLYENNFIDINGNETDTWMTVSSEPGFTASMFEQIFLGFFNNEATPEARAEEENAIVTETRQWLIDAGADPNTVDNLGYESLLEAVDYANSFDQFDITTDLGFSQEDLLMPLYEEMSAQDLYNFYDGKEGLENNITTAQLDQLAENMLSKNPYSWFDGIEGVNITDYGPLITAAIPYFQDVIQGEYQAWRDSGWQWGS